MDAVNTLALVTILGGVIHKVVERIRAHWPKIDGDLVTLVAWAIGVLVAWAFGLRATVEIAKMAGISLGAVPVAIDYVLTGLGIAAGAGIIADVTGRSGSKPGTLIVPEVTDAPDLPEGP